MLHYGMCAWLPEESRKLPCDCAEKIMEHDASMARMALDYYNDDEPTLEMEAVNPLQSRCDFLEWQARLYWLAEPKIKDFVAKMAEGRGQDEEDRVSGIAWSRDEFGLKASCYARAEEAWNNTTG